LKALIAYENEIILLIVIYLLNFKIIFMILKLKAYKDFGNNDSLDIGIMTIQKNEIVSFKESDNCKFYKDHSSSIFPIKRAFYTIAFLDKYHIEHKAFQASIQIKDSVLVYVKLKRIEKVKLKWMLEKYDIQSKEMKMDFYKYIIGGIFGILFSVTTQVLIQKYNAELQTSPKKGIQKSLGNKNFKNIDK
jgi:hypothetical protein